MQYDVFNNVILMIFGAMVILGFFFLIVYNDIKTKELEVRYCPECGKTITTRKISFFKRRTLKKQTGEDPESYFRYCPRCATKNASNSNFCMYCGEAFVEHG